jgi:hypothetical protein
VVLDRIVSCQLVQLELLGDGDKLFLRGLVEGNPGEPVRSLAEAVGFPQRTRRRKPASTGVDSAIDNHAPLYANAGVLFLLATLETFTGTARHILGAKRCCPTALVSLQPKSQRTVLVSRGFAESRKRVVFDRRRAGGEACDGHPIGRARDVVGEPYGNSVLCLYVASLLRTHVDRLFSALFAGGRNL